MRDDRSRIETLATGVWIRERESLLIQRPPGVGKTHLAVAIAYRAIQNGFDALFTTAAHLIDELSAAFREGRLAEALTTYTHPDLLVIDEVGYLTYGTDAANMLFHVVNDRHRRKRSMIFTTNKPPLAWGKVLHDEDLAQAIVDRVLERGRLLTLDGPSMRTSHLGLDDPTLGASNHAGTNLARISGIPRPEFPEPTGPPDTSGGPHACARSDSRAPEGREGSVDCWYNLFVSPWAASSAGRAPGSQSRLRRKHSLVGSITCGAEQTGIPVDWFSSGSLDWSNCLRRTSNSRIAGFSRVALGLPATV